MLKGIKANSSLDIIKSAMFGVLLTVVLIMILAFSMKFIDFNNSTIRVINLIIKIMGVAFSVILIMRKIDSKYLLKGAITGFVYAVLTFLMFSIIGKQFSFNLSVLIDLLTMALIGAVCTVIFGCFKKV